MPPAPRPQSVLAAAMATSAAPGVIGTEGQLRFVGLCAILLSGHLLAALVPGLGRRVVSESLFLADSALALYCLNRARLRSCGSARTFWLLFLSALGVFAGANILWFCALVVGRFPFESLLVLSYRLYAVPVAMTFFVREGGEGQSGCGKERALDFLQLGILTWLAVFVLYYLPSFVDAERTGALRGGPPRQHDQPGAAGTLLCALADGGLARIARAARPFGRLRGRLLHRCRGGELHRSGRPLGNVVRWVLGPSLPAGGGGRDLLGPGLHGIGRKRGAAQPAQPLDRESGGRGHLPGGGGALRPRAGALALAGERGRRRLSAGLQRAAHAFPASPSRGIAGPEADGKEAGQ